MKNLIMARDTTYSPLALYFLLDNELLKDKQEINRYFDVLINETNLETEVKNLIIYKKVYTIQIVQLKKVIKYFKPLINNDNLWRSHSLYIIASIFSKDEKQNQKNSLKRF